MQSSLLVSIVVLVLASTASGIDLLGRDRVAEVSASASSEQYVPTSLAEVSLSITIERKAVAVTVNDSSASELDGSAVEQGLVQAAIEANAELARRANQLIGVLRVARVEKLRTTSASLEQVFEYPQNEPARQIGVRVREGLSFRTNLTLVGELLTAVVEAGATRIDGVSFVAADDEIEQAKLTAIRQAVQKAKLRASIALQEAGCAGTIAVDSVTLNTQDGGQPQPMILAADAAPLAKSFGGPTARPLPVIGGENVIAVQASVRLYCLPGPGPVPFPIGRNPHP